MLPTRRALILLALGLPLAVVPTMVPLASLVVVASWIALGIGFAYDVSYLSKAGLRARFAPAATAAVGGSFDVKVQVRRAPGTRLRAQLRTEVSEPLFEGEVVDVLVGEKGLETTLRAMAPRRGRGRVDAVWMKCEGPLGLVERIDRFVYGAQHVDVIPDVARVAKTVLEHLGAEPMLGGLRRDPWSGSGSEFESLQTYVQGMDLRGVDWKATARHQALRVRRFHLERRQRVVLSLDVGRAMRDPIDGLDRIDHAVHTGLALARTALLAGDLVGMHAYADRPAAYVPPKAGTAQFQRLRRNAAQIAVRAEETNHVLGLRDLLARLDRRTFVVVFTEFSDTTTAELMIDALGQLARKHLVVFVALDDPTIEEPLREPARDAHALASAVVAGSLGERRLEVLARLHTLGVHVIHTRSGLVAGKLLARYLEVKKKGLLG